MKQRTEHSKRIQSELKAAGMTFYGLTRQETAQLPSIIHDNEHIHGVVYGRIKGKSDSVMLVATDRRVVFLDCKPLYKNWDEVTYEVVAGIHMSVVRPFAAVVLHTRVKDYEIRYVNIGCAEIFARYIEQHIEQQNSSDGSRDAHEAPAAHTAKKIQPYRIDHHKEPLGSEVEKEAEEMDDTAILSTVGVDNRPHASVIHFEIDKDENFYFLTKSETQKIKNIIHNSAVALTIHHSHSLKVLYLKGSAEIVNNKELASAVYQRIAKVNSYREGEKLAPVTKISKGDYLVIKIKPESSQYFDYSTDSW